MESQDLSAGFQRWRPASADLRAWQAVRHEILAPARLRHPAPITELRAARIAASSASTPVHSRSSRLSPMSCGKLVFRSVDQPSAASQFPPLRGIVSERAKIQARCALRVACRVSRAGPLPGLHAVGVPRNPSKRRGMPEGTERQALSRGNTRSRFQALALGHARGAQQAYRNRVRAVSDCYGSEAVYRQITWPGSERGGLRTSRHDHRPHLCRIRNRAFQYIIFSVRPQEALRPGQ